MGRVERSTESQGGAFSLFEGNILLSNQIKKRTEQLKALNEELDQRTNQLQLIIRALPGSVILFSSDFNVLQHFRGSGAEIPIDTKIRFDEAYGPEFKKNLNLSIESQQNSNAPQSFEFQGLNHDAHRTFSSTVSAISNDLFVIYIRDVTEEHQQMATIQNQKAQILQASKLSSLGEMAGSIAHEINNPLAIMSAIAFRITTLLGKEPINKEKILENLTKIQDTITRISKIVKSMRQISRDATRDELVTCDIGVLADEVLDLCREKFTSNGVILKIDLPKEQKVRCQKIQLSQVILNLLNNSYHVAKSMSGGWVQIATTDVGSKIRIHVVDSGTGIPAEVQAKLFQPFFTTKDVGEGTGLGLSISRQIISEHGSTLEYELREGHTSFFFDLEKGE